MPNRIAVAAWESLGPLKDTDAKPYRTADLLSKRMLNMTGDPEATRLQETSAQLNQIVQQRLGQRDNSSPSRGARVDQPARAGPTR